MCIRTHHNVCYVTCTLSSADISCHIKSSRHVITCHIMLCSIVIHVTNTCYIKHISYSISTSTRPAALFGKMKTQFKIHEVAISTLKSSILVLQIVLPGICSRNFHCISHIFFVPTGTMHVRALIL